MDVFYSSASFISGLGGNGSTSDHTVRSGLFRCGAWKTATGECLKREFRGAPPDADHVAITLKEPHFIWFEVMLRVNIHEGMHCFIGMFTTRSRLIHSSLVFRTFPYAISLHKQHGCVQSFVFHAFSLFLYFEYRNLLPRWNNVLSKVCRSARVLFASWFHRQDLGRLSISK